MSNASHDMVAADPLWPPLFAKRDRPVNSARTKRMIHGELDE